MKLFFLKTFLSSADDIIKFLDDLESYVRSMAVAAVEEAEALEKHAQAIRQRAAAANNVANRIRGS